MRQTPLCVHDEDAAVVRGPADVYITGRFSKRSRLCTVQCVRFVFFFSTFSWDAFCVYRRSPHAALQPMASPHTMVFVMIPGECAPHVHLALFEGEFFG